MSFSLSSRSDQELGTHGLVRGEITTSRLNRRRTSALEDISKSVNLRNNKLDNRVGLENPS